ncbi:hypothetical protein [Methylobrevis albus]|uniref:Cytoplasmic protein n=1 Tax=Methylobrevis albus TaxID=2793297 RepID=A0A931MYJ2_9HYPH|nr:hypothetical protein [Methylobrevis albus]MBH0238477.1 hypothetical protein [Methylobrevis albus]
MRLPSLMFAAFAVLTAPALAADYYGGGQRPVAAVEVPGVPACDDAGVLGTIATRHAGATPETKNGVEIALIERIGAGYVVANGPSSIVHRHCAATALLSTGGRDELVYRISQRQGFASIGWNVEFCLARNDAWYVYGAGCRSLR